VRSHENAGKPQGLSPITQLPTAASGAEATAVPTLSEWAVIVLNLILACGVFAGMNRTEMK
jgi:hypothetical protein